MRINTLTELHKRVIHTEWKTISQSAIELENKWIKSYPYDVIEVVCGDCFGRTNKDLIAGYIEE